MEQASTPLNEVLGFIINVVIGVGWAVVLVSVPVSLILLVLYFTNDNVKFKKTVKGVLIGLAILPFALFLWTAIRFILIALLSS